ncbi:ubiquitin-like protein, putative [Plasmodium vivax]|uniref:Ubiquitin-like protein, putative n=1 Tax=Plasmodium vivax TaxID=5855 RepID=A0A1G4GVD5_PLAVI|nr:ubiquitin-like protein, putative [Plasmodium vivax]
MEEEGSIKIKIKSIDNEEFELAVKGETSAEEIKNTIAERKSVDKQDIRLIYQGQCLANEKSVADYNIQNEHIIHLVVRKKENPAGPNDENGSAANASNTANAANTANTATASANMFRSNDGSVMGDPLHINFSSNVHLNSSSGNIPNGGTASNMPNGSANPNAGSSTTPLYFTHMRLTRNDNMDGDLMGQTNICSLLNDIMSQVNINPNFIYGAATAAATAAANGNAAGVGGGLGSGMGSGLGGGLGSGLGSGMGNGENIFTAAMRTTGINLNSSEFAAPSYANGAHDQKSEPANMNTNVNANVNANSNAGAGGKSHNGHNEPDGKTQRQRGTKGGDGGGQGHAGESKSESSSDVSNANDKGNDADCTKEQQKKMKKLKKKRKNNNKDMKVSNKLKKNGKYHFGLSSKDDSSSSSHSGSSHSGSSHSGSSLLSADTTMKGEEERKKALKLKKHSKKKKLKSKHKKKKSYDSSSSSSGSEEDQHAGEEAEEEDEDDYDDDELSKKEKKHRKKEKKKKKKKKKKYLFDPNFLYHQNYMYHPNSISHARINNHFNHIFRGRNDLRLAAAYPPFVLDHGGRPSVGGPFYRESRNSLKYGRDELSETNENANGTSNHNMADELGKQKERRKKAHSSSKALFGGAGAQDNLADLPGGTGGPMDEHSYPPRGAYANIVPLSDTERNNELVRNDSVRTNSRVALNEEEGGALLSDNNSLSANMRSIQMSSDRRNSALGRSDLKCLNDANDSEHKNMEVNIPWRVIEQLLVLLEEETGYRRPDLSSYINSYHNTNSIFVFFYLFVHINNIINNIIIQFNHSNFMNNDISMSSFSRISIILSLASVVFSRLSNFFFVFYDNVYCNNYGRHYRYSDPINHAFFRELRNLYYSNHGRNAHSSRSSRFYQNDVFPNGNYGHGNVGAFPHDPSSYLHNVTDGYYPLPYNDLRNHANRTNLQQEFEDYYKNYLNTVKGNKNMLLRKEFAGHKDRSNNGECPQGKEDGVSSNRVGKGDKLGNPSAQGEKKMSSRFRQAGQWNGTANNASNHLNNGANGYCNNPFSNFPGQANKSLLYPGLKKRSDEKEAEKKGRDGPKPYPVKEALKDGHSYRGYSSGDPNESSSSGGAGAAAAAAAGLGAPLNHFFNNLVRNKNEERENGKMASNGSPPKSEQHEDEAKGDAPNATNSNFASCDSNMDDMYDVSDDGKEREALNMKDHHPKGEDKDGKYADKGKGTHPGSIPQKEKPTDKHTTPQGEKSPQQIVPQGGDIKNAASSRTDSSSVTDIRRPPPLNSAPPMPNMNFSNILNCVQNQMAGGGGVGMQTEPPRDKFEGMPEEVKTRYKTWVENTQIFSGQMIKICRNRRPLSNAYIGDGSSKNEISFSNLLPFLWKRNMSTINLDVNLEISDDLINAFDMHVLEFVKKSIKNNEDYKLEKFKYPTLSLCEELFDEMEKKDK